MRIGILGDIHANRSALAAVFNALDDEGCDQLICTGDIVGYGPSPAECVQLLRERDIPCVLGNHDKFATLLASPRLAKLEADTRQVLEWTQSVLDMDALRWLAELPLRLDFEELTLLHGSFGPNRWAYLVNKKNLATSFAHQDVPLAVSGHSHLPVLCQQVEGHPPHMGFLRTADVPQDRKVLINPGSVGQPRDRDPRAACAVYDTETAAIRPLRVEYDIAETQALMREANLPGRFSRRLEEGR